jgi:hypothetical protein
METSKVAGLRIKELIKSSKSFIKTAKQGRFKYGHTRQVALFARISK